MASFLLSKMYQREYAERLENSSFLLKRSSISKVLSRGEEAPIEWSKLPFIITDNSTAQHQVWGGCSFRCASFAPLNLWVREGEGSPPLEMFFDSFSSLHQVGNPFKAPDLTISVKSGIRVLEVSPEITEFYIICVQVRCARPNAKNRKRDGSIYGIRIRPPLSPPY